jgi:KDO2-lipid IV(A) lauroyltransferase
MDLLLYWIAVAVLALLQALPVGAVAWLGRTVGGIVFWCDARHRRVAITNIGTCLGNGKTEQEIHALARENFRRIGESYGCAVKTASLHPDELKRRLEIVGLEKLMRLNADGVLPSRIVAVGHFGNFELYASLVRWSKGYRPASTYRALHSERLNRLLRKIRAHSGCRFFERRTEGGARPALRPARAGAFRPSPVPRRRMFHQHRARHLLASFQNPAPHRHLLPREVRLLAHRSRRRNPHARIR